MPPPRASRRRQRGCSCPVSAVFAQAETASIDFKACSSARSLLRRTNDSSAVRSAGLDCFGPSGRGPLPVCERTSVRHGFHSSPPRTQAVTGIILNIGTIQVILTGDPNQSEQGIAAGIGQSCAHALRVRHFSNRADWPIGGDPFARSMRQHGGQIDHPGRVIDGGGLHRGDLMLAERLAHDV